MKRIARCLTVLFIYVLAQTGTAPVFAQTDAGVFDPADPIRLYDPAAPPQQPPSGQVGKWVKSDILGWNTESFKAYIYKGIPFRLKYPRNWDKTKQYPLYVYLHGLGEYGSIYNNDYQLYIGAVQHAAAVDNGTFDGFLLFPQNQSGPWSSTHLSTINQLIDQKLIPQLNVDPFRIIISGISGGAASAWSFTNKYTKQVGALVPISAASSSYYDSVNKYKWTPLWHFQGGLDIAPTPATSRSLGKKILAAGGNYRYNEYPDLAHYCWDRAWEEPDYFPFLMRAHKANPWALSGRTEFCAGDGVQVTIGVTAGFEGYEWRKNGVLIPGATANQISATSLGTYDCRIKRGTVWSVWSPIPVVLKTKTPTVTPNIQVSGLASPVIPAPDGSTSVKLEVPEGYVGYNWQREGDTTVLSTTRFLTAVTPGAYKVKVTEQYGCSSAFSSLFAVVHSAGRNAPPPVAGLIANAASKTGIQLSWSQYAAPTYNETAFEVYGATAAEGPYKLVYITAADATAALIENLTANTTHHFKVRAVNGNGASPVVGPVAAATFTDNTAPTAPGNLHVIATTQTSVTLLWNEASDDVGVSKYDIYINGIKTYVTDKTGYMVPNLTKNQTYAFTVKARDAAGNTSPFSNQATATTILTGLTYKYYEGLWTDLPDLHSITPIKTGTTRNVDVALRNKVDSFAFLWEGYLRIPVPGSYTFRTVSNDGSKLFLGPYVWGGWALINNDGMHGAQAIDSTITLDAGVYPISIAYFDRTGEDVMSVWWRTPLSGGNFLQLPDSAFTEAPVVNGRPPAAPGTLTATATSHKNINLSWSDNSPDETGFEILRSKNTTGGFVAIARTGAGTIAFSDTLVDASTTYFYYVQAVNQYGVSAAASNSGQAQATTHAMPDLPQPPTNLLAVAASSKTVNITWTDNATTETAYELYRSGNGNTAYVLLKTLPANATTYRDTGLFANTVFYYTVKAANAGGSTAGAEDSAKTANNRPVLTPIENQYMKWGTQLQLAVHATDADPEAVTLSALNLPSFATFVAGGDGGGTLAFNPASSHQGTYTVTITATDQNGGSDAAMFQLVVSSNNNPVLKDAMHVTVAEKKTAQVTLTATDADASDVLGWSFTGLPPFASVFANGGTAQITFAPGYADAGIYAVQARVKDSKNAFDTTSFIVTVTDVVVDKAFYINFNAGSNATGVWNNLAMAPARGAARKGFKDAFGNASTVGLKVLSDWAADGLAVSSGATTGNNSGVFPDVVMKTGWQAGKVAQTFQLTGLDPTLRYSLTFFSSKAATSGDHTTQFTVNGSSVFLNARNNTTQTVSLYAVPPAADSTITVQLKNGPLSTYAYINAMVVESGYEDGSKPLLPQDLTGIFQNNGVTLSWKDKAYNESEYRVYRATMPNGPYEVLKKLPRNTVTYADSIVQANRTYHYKLQAATKQDSSGLTDVASVAVGNLAPVLHAVADQTLKSDTTVTLSITATDDPTDVVTITGANMPPFATLASGGNGKANLQLAPTVNDVGVYKNVSITAADDKDGATTKTFTLTIRNKDLSTVLVNFNASSGQAAPWNNFNSNPTAGKTVSNLKDEWGAATGINITLVDAWRSSGTSGVITGADSGVFPDGVLKTYYSDTGRSVKRIRLSGLSATKRYNLSFLASRATTGTLITTYMAGGRTVSLNAAGNSTNLATISGLAPDASGIIEIGVARDAASSTAYLNALRIQAYNSSITLTPTTLAATAASKTSIQLAWTDNSADETGFEIWRALSANGPFTLIQTAPANIATYTDRDLSENRFYFYKVRAKAAAQASAYSNVAMASPLAYVVYQNFNLDNPAAAPWNNTNRAPEPNAVFDDLKNDQGQSSGINITIVNNFSGLNAIGMNTGNNSGVVPDNVMRASYYCDKGVVARLRVDGLSQTSRYNFIFFASRNGSGDRTTLYTIGSQTVSLNASYNTTKTAQLNGVAPDAEGAVYINVTNAATSQYGYLNGLIIQSYSAAPANSPEGLSQMARIDVAPHAAEPQQAAHRQRTVREEVGSRTNAKAYPNPFTDDITVQVPVAAPVALVTVQVLDASGTVLYTQPFRNVSAGLWQQRLPLGRHALKPGFYFIRISGLPEKEVQVLKLLKAN